MLDRSLSLSSVYTSQHTCELSFLLCYEKQFVSSSPSVVPLEMEVEEVLTSAQRQGHKMLLWSTHFCKQNCTSS